MSTVNGLAGLQTNTITPNHITGKRKRVESVDDPQSGGVEHINPQESDKNPPGIQQLLVDILAVSKIHDTTPSILNLPIISTTNGAHAAKRTKLSEPKESTIASLIESNQYTDLKEVMIDVDLAVSTVVGKLQQQITINNELRSFALSRELRAEITQATALKKIFDNLILREIIQRPKSLASKRSENGVSHKTSTSDSTIQSVGIDNDSIVGTPVLTLYGYAPHPKQLFSSLQQPIRKISMSSEFTEDQSPIDNSPDSQKSAIVKDLSREHALPNGISITKVVPVHSSNSPEGGKKVLTLGELFAPPPNLPPLNPPRQSRHTATRSSSVNWLSTSESSSSGRPHQRSTYPSQPLSAGQWLSYNSTPSSIRLSSPGARRKERDRALSFGEPQPSLTEENVAAHHQAKEDALFRSVYSSFAPGRDNTAALVPEYIKNQVWWKRIGENKLQNVLEITESEDIDEVDRETDSGDHPTVATQDDEFNGTVEDWVSEELPPELEETKQSIVQTPENIQEADEILQEISKLLETLNSYQRVRNLSLANTARTGANSQLTAMSGSPTSPSPAEFDVYNLLKSQLTLMVSTLPPHAMAKLGGEKLGALNINTKIPVKDINHAGVMEEDETSAKAKQITQSPSATYSSRPVNAGASVAPRGNGYVHSTTTPAQPVQRSAYTPQPRPANTPSSYLPNQQYSRPASSNHYFSGTAHTSYPSHRPISNSERYSYSASQQYSQRPAQSSHTQFQNGYRAYPTHNGTSYSQQFSSPQIGTSSSSQVQGSHSQRPSQPGYQQKAMNSQAFGYGTSSLTNEPPPSKPSNTYSPQTQRAAFVAQNQTPSQQRPSSYHQHSSHLGAHTPSRQVNGAALTSSTGQHTYMTADEQSALMNRQKAQLAEQQKSSSRQGSGTPQPTNGNQEGQQNGTAISQPNGIISGQGQ